MNKNSHYLTFALLALLAASMLMPFLWMISTSLMGELEVYQFPPKLFPSTLRWANFVEAMTLQPFWRFFFNSAVLAGASVAGQLLFCSMAAYAFSRMRFKWRDGIFNLYLATMMIPAIVTVIPAFLLITIFGWINTYWALATPTLSSVWGIFLLRQFFQTIPKDLEDAARVDGASDWTVFWRVVLPLSGLRLPLWRSSHSWVAGGISSGLFSSRIAWTCERSRWELRTSTPCTPPIGHTRWPPPWWSWCRS